MKLGSIVLSSALFASALLATTAAPIANAPQPKVAVIVAPGAISGVSTIIATATVQKIDKKTREVTLKKESGEVVKIIAPQEVRNFAQIKIGDLVTSQYTTTVDIRVVKGVSNEVGYSVQESSSRAKLGEKPMATSTRIVSMRSKVTKIDPQTQTVTLEGQKGNSEIVVKDPQQLAHVQVGDMVDSIASESVAISVAPAKKK